MKTCPECQLINPDTAVACDCGYNFSGGPRRPDGLSKITMFALAVFVPMVPLIISQQFGFLPGLLSGILSASISGSAVFLLTFHKGKKEASRKLQNQSPVLPPTIPGTVPSPEFAQPHLLPVASSEPPGLQRRLHATWWSRPYRALFVAGVVVALALVAVFALWGVRVSQSHEWLKWEVARLEVLERDRQAGEPAEQPTGTSDTSVKSSHSSVTDLPRDTASVAGGTEKLYDRLSKQVVTIECEDWLGTRIKQGSGVILNKPSYSRENKGGSDIIDILTSFHVIMFAKDIIVTVKDGAPSTAFVFFFDADRDLAVLRIPKNFLEDDIELADIELANDQRVGQRVFALGTPEGLGWSISDGIISALRESSGMTLIQTTAPISSGSSGGGLFDEQGRLLGITAFRVVEGQNLNFAVAITPRLMQELFKERQYLGLDPVNVTYDDWVVGHFRSSPPELDWRATHPHWQKWRFFNEQAMALMQKELQAFKTTGKMVPSTGDALPNLYALRYRSFPRDVEGLLNAIHFLEKDVEARTLLIKQIDAVHQNKGMVFSFLLEELGKQGAPQKKLDELMEGVIRSIPEKSSKAKDIRFVEEMDSFLASMALEFHSIRSGKAMLDTAIRGARPSTPLG